MSRFRTLLLTPGMLVMSALFAIPMLIIAVYTFLTRGSYGGVAQPWTAMNYVRVFDPLYGAILWRSVYVAAVSTGICLMLGYPLALRIVRSKKHQTLLLNLVMLPFWTSLLLRTYALMFLLRDTGLINTALLSLHVIREPLPLLFNPGAVIVGLVYAYLPFMVLPLYATLEKMGPVLLDAASDLGARPVAALWRVMIPLTKPGIIAGCVLVFVPCLGAYLTPDLLGGGKTVMLGNLVQNQFTTARDWPFGSAISLLLLLVALGVARIAGNVEKELL